MRRGFAFLGVGLVAGVTACSLLVDANKDQCATDSDCVARGASFANAVCIDSKCVASALEDAAVEIADSGTPDAPTGPWRCVGNITWPKVDLTRTITLTQTFTDFVNGAPLAGIGLKSCLRADVACANPFSTATSDDAGRAPISLPYAFDGYWLLLPNDPETVNMLVYELPPPVKDDLATPTQTISRSNLSTLGSLMGVTIDPAMGQLSVSVVDCDGKRAAGVSIDVSPLNEGSRIYYLENKIPNRQRTFTDENGFCGATNLTPGVVNITAKLAESGTVVAKYAALVQADKFTTFVLPPSPGVN